MPREGAIIFSDLIGKLELNGPGRTSPTELPAKHRCERHREYFTLIIGDVQDPGPPVLRTRTSNQCVNDLLSTIAGFNDILYLTSTPVDNQAV
jgi:hypothetical protein